MRKKEKPINEFGVSDGLDFETDVEVPQKELPKTNHTSTKKVEIDPNRCYSKYYTPKPKKGSKGGTLGRGSVDAQNRKLQFSLTCTPTQKQRFMEASQKEHRKLSDFICLAVEEYIQNHQL